MMQAQQRVGHRAGATGLIMSRKREHDAYPHGAWHGNEVPYVFDNLRLTDPVRQYASEADLAFAAQVADYWTQFARLASGEQTLSGAVRWPACLRGRDRLLRIGLHKRAGL